jgi:hypothetical protein
MKLNFLHICENAFFSEDKKLNIIGIFNTINTSAFPATHPKFSIAINISDYKNESGVLLVQSPNKETFIEIPIEKDKLSENKNNANIVLNFIGATFPVEGKYPVILKTDKTIIEGRDDHILLQKI